MIDNTGNSTAVLLEMKVKQESWRALFSCTVSSRHKGAFHITAGGLQQQQQYLLSKTSENKPLQAARVPREDAPSAPEEASESTVGTNVKGHKVPHKGSLCLRDQRDARFGKKVSPGRQAPPDS